MRKERKAEPGEKSRVNREEGRVWATISVLPFPFQVTVEGDRVSYTCWARLVEVDETSN